jgi:hypothetical protein
MMIIPISSAFGLEFLVFFSVLLFRFGIFDGSMRWVGWAYVQEKDMTASIRHLDIINRGSVCFLALAIDGNGMGALWDFGCFLLKSSGYRPWPGDLG